MRDQKNTKLIVRVQYWKARKLVRGQYIAGAQKLQNILENIKFHMGGDARTAFPCAQIYEGGISFQSG